MSLSSRAIVLALSMIVLALAPVFAQSVPVPSGIETEGVPSIPRALVRTFDDYRVIPGYTFAGWFGGRREMLVAAGDERTAQVFSVVNPGAVPQQQTRGGDRVMGIYPRPGRNQFAFAYDRGGDESAQLALFDTPTRRSTRLTDGQGRHFGPVWSADGLRLAYVADNGQSSEQDLHVLDLSGSVAAPKRVVTLPGLTTITDWSPEGDRLAVINIDPRRGTRALIIEIENGQEEILFPSQEHPAVDNVAGLRFSRDGQALFFTLYNGSEFRRLGRFNPRAGELTVFTAKIAWDVEEFDLCDDGRTLAATINQDGVSRLRMFDTETGEERTVPALPEGLIFGLQFRPGARELGFNLSTAQEPPHAFSYLLTNRTMVRWTRGQPGGPRFGKAAEPERFRFRSFDGREIPAWIYRPEPGRFPDPRPVLVDFHGGPQAQARAGFLGPENYFINELGVVLIRPNVRGSSGYGRSFLTLDDGLRRVGVLRDIGALLDWIAEQDDLDASRVAVSGSSYGGFLVLAALVRYGDRIRAGINIAGISSFETFLNEQKDPLRLDLLRLEFGDERDPDTLAFLRSISPLEHAERIDTPLLVAQGANDPRVPVEQARQIVNAVHANGVPVWYVLASDEGHGYANRSNREYLYYVQIFFLFHYMKE
ncbi:S9 family peptidase [soil metagenome]